MLFHDGTERFLRSVILACAVCITSNCPSIRALWYFQTDLLSLFLCFPELHICSVAEGFKKFVWIQWLQFFEV